MFIKFRLCPSHLRFSFPGTGFQRLASPIRVCSLLLSHIPTVIHPAKSHPTHLLKLSLCLGSGGGAVSIFVSGVDKLRGAPPDHLQNALAVPCTHLQTAIYERHTCGSLDRHALVVSLDMP